MAKKQLGTAPDEATEAATKGSVEAVSAVKRVVTGTGIDLTGTTNSDTAFQAILNAAAADAAAGAGIVEVYIPPGTLLLTTKMTVGAGVTLRGAGRTATTVKSSAAIGLELTGASNITISDLTVECITNANSIAVIGTYVAGVQRRVSITGCRIIGTTNGVSAVRFPYAVDQLTFADNLIENCSAGFVVYAPTLASGFISTNIVISRNKCRNVGSVNLQVYGGINDGNVSTVHGVEISSNDLREFAQTGPAGPIPIEPTCITNLVIANNTIDGTATRGVSTGNNINMTITGNTVRNQSMYAFELNGGRQISIVGNTVENCATFAMESGYIQGDFVAPNPVRLSDVVIANNVYTGSGRSSAGTAADVIRLATARRVRVSGNIFNNWQHVRAAIRIGDAVAPLPEDCVIEGNTFVISDANTPLTTINIRSAIRTNIVRNTFRINRNLVAGDDNITAITAVMDALSADTVIHGNQIMFTGTVAAAPDASGIGNGFASPAACPRLTIRRNHIVNGPRGLNLRTNSTDLVVEGNDATTCVGADIIPATAINGPRIDRVLDANGKMVLSLPAAASAVNHVEAVNASTGNSVQLRAATGSGDANVGMLLRPKGTGFVSITNAGAGIISRFVTSTTPVNYWTLSSSDTNSALAATATGTDSNISVNLVPKGTGTVQAGGVPVATKLTSTATLDFGSVSAQSFADLTITVTGAATGDAVALGTPTEAVTAGIVYSSWVSATNTVTVRAHNYTAGPLDPASGTFRATIIR